MTPEQFVALRDLGVAGLLAFALIGGFRGWYVFSWTYRAVEEDRDFWRATALKALGHTDKALEVVEKAARDA